MNARNEIKFKREGGGGVDDPSPTFISIILEKEKKWVKVILFSSGNFSWEGKEVPSVKIVPITYEKLHCKGETCSAVINTYRYTRRQTDRLLLLQKNICNY